MWSGGAGVLGGAAVTVGKLRSLVARKGGAGQRPPLRLRRSPLRVDCPAVLGLAACRRTRCVHFVHSAQTAAASQLWRRAARAGRKPCAPRRRRVAAPAARPRLCRAGPHVANGVRAQSRVWAKPRVGGRWSDSAAPRSGGLGASARSAPPRLTCGSLSERRERSERSEFCRGPRDRAPEGSRRAASTAAVGAQPATRPRLRPLGSSQHFSEAGNRRI